MLSFSQHHGQIDVDFPNLELRLNGVSFPLRLTRGSYVLGARPVQQWSERVPEATLTDVSDVSKPAALRALARQAAANAEAGRQASQVSARPTRAARRAERAAELKKHKATACPELRAQSL